MFVRLCIGRRGLGIGLDLLGQERHKSLPLTWEVIRVRVLVKGGGGTNSIC
jgi:hypothetical protein